MKIGGDFSKLSALEAQYDKDCHALYMKNKLSSSGGKSPYDDAFDRLVDYLMPLLNNRRATEMSNLLDKYKGFLSEIESEDDIDSNSYRTEHLKAWMQKHFGQTIAFADQKRKTSSQIVYSSSIDMKNVINIASNYKEALTDLKVIGEVEDIQNDAGLDSYDRVLFYAGSAVKAEIKNVTGINTAPLSPDEISLAKANEIIPKCLISLLSLICGTSDDKEQMVLAIAQDIIMVTFEDMIIRLGGFHRVKNFLGRRMEESGIEQISEELFGPSQLSSILKGSKYNRGIAAHKSLVEMLPRRKWKSFREWAEQKNDGSLNELIGGYRLPNQKFHISFC